MHKFLNIFMIIVIIIFMFVIFDYYSSNNNINIKRYNRVKVDEILNKKIKDLPILINDTNNVIEFNDSFEEELDKNKKRSFWDLLKPNEK
tara:strand:- start:457 stop:726 length:270 start_codon:yes stop_codon:yes gene_type:complete